MKEKNDGKCALNKVAHAPPSSQMSSWEENLNHFWHFYACTSFEVSNFVLGKV